MNAVNEKFKVFAQLIKRRFGGDLAAIKSSGHHWLVRGKRGRKDDLELLGEFGQTIIRTCVAVLVPVFLRLWFHYDAKKEPVFRIKLSDSGEELYRRWVEPALEQEGIFKIINDEGEKL